MICKNTDFKALQRLRFEEEPDESKYCPVCGTEKPEKFYVSIQTDECIGCSDCIDEVMEIDY